jgi:DNA-binding MarR family transcriptional regulator
MVLWENDAQPVNDIAKRLMLETNTVTPLLKRMEQQGILVRSKGSADARQVIVTLTDKGRNMQNQLSEVPMKVGNAVLCRSVTPDTVPALFGMLDDIIDKLDNR